MTVRNFEPPLDIWFLLTSPGMKNLLPFVTVSFTDKPTVEFLFLLNEESFLVRSAICLIPNYSGHVRSASGISRAYFVP